MTELRERMHALYTKRLTAAIMNTAKGDMPVFTDMVAAEAMEMAYYLGREEAIAECAKVAENAELPAGGRAFDGVNGAFARQTFELARDCAAFSIRALSAPKEEKADADGWIPYDGGDEPLAHDPEAVVEVEFRNGSTATNTADAWLWGWRSHSEAPGDIIGYRVVSAKPKPAEPAPDPVEMIKVPLPDWLGPDTPETRAKLQAFVEGKHHPMMTEARFRAEYENFYTTDKNGNISCEPAPDPRDWRDVTVTAGDLFEALSKYSRAIVGNNIVEHPYVGIADAVKCHAEIIARKRAGGE